MKFTVPVQTIIDPITRVADICVSNSSNPDDLAQFLMLDVKKDAITMTGTDGAVQLKAVIPLPEGACESEGSFLMMADRASDFFKVLGSNDDVSLELKPDDDLLQIFSAQNDYSMRVRPVPEDNSFPLFALEEEEAPKFIEIEENKLRYMLDKAVFCVSRDNYRDYLKGVRFEIENTELSIFALDGHRMAAVQTQLENPPEGEVKFLMTLRGVTELQKLLSNNQDTKIKLAVTENFIYTQINCYTIVNRLLKCKYPNVRGVLPKDCAPELHIPLEELKLNVKRVALFSNKRLNLVNFTFTHNLLTLNTQNSEHETGKAIIPIDYPDETGHRESNLNYDYVREILNATDTDEVVFCFAPPYSNTQIRPKDEVNEMGVRIRYVVSHIMV
ncbi:MAG TPA: DNA polymerase III subunit beta [Candidatus Anaerobiospirillum stercoravium]|nr:DNA polymerase III subunit beta [Candidatus Anaerobiospirillum stercoravium]